MNSQEFQKEPPVTAQDIEDFGDMVPEFTSADEDYYYLTTNAMGSAQAIQKIPDDKIKRSVDYNNPKLKNLWELVAAAQSQKSEKNAKFYTTVGFIVTDLLHQKAELNSSQWRGWKIAFVKINDKYEGD